MKVILQVLLLASIGLIFAGSAVSEKMNDKPTHAEKAYADIMKFATSTEEFEVGKNYYCEMRRTGSTSGRTGKKVERESSFPNLFFLMIMECHEDDFMCGTLHETRIDLRFLERNMAGDLDWRTLTFTGLAGEYYGVFAGQLSLLNKSLVWTKADTDYDDDKNTVSEILIHTASADCSLDNS